MTAFRDPVMLVAYALVAAGAARVLLRLYGGW
jgi:hypothetical protein